MFNLWLSLLHKMRGVPGMNGGLHTSHWVSGVFVCSYLVVFLRIRFASGGPLNCANGA